MKNKNLAQIWTHWSLKQHQNLLLRQKNPKLPVAAVLPHQGQHRGQHRGQHQGPRQPARLAAVDLRRQHQGPRQPTPAAALPRLPMFAAVRQRQHQPMPAAAALQRRLTLAAAALQRQLTLAAVIQHQHHHQIVAVSLQRQWCTTFAVVTSPEGESTTMISFQTIPADAVTCAAGQLLVGLKAATAAVVFSPQRRKWAPLVSLQELR